jgi:HD-like signal output (HDOD) protein
MSAQAISSDSATGRHSAIAFQFVADLAAEVSEGRVELPAFPDVATRVRKALGDEKIAPDHIARIVGSEAGLAARVMTLANSAALNRTGKNITELKTAINRIGHNNVRTAAVAFAISQLRRAEDLRPIMKQLEKLWNEATLVSALCHALSKRMPEVNTDEAMLTGLIHNVGKIYIMARAHKHEELFADPEAMRYIMRDWQANVGKAIVENWGFAQHIADAVGEQEDVDRVAGYADLTDVLTVAALAASYAADEYTDLELNMQGVRAFSRMGLDNEKFAQVMSDSVEEMSALRSALGN